MAVTLDAIAKSGGTYRGVACVEDGISEVELRRLHDGGIRGIRFNFVKHLGGVPDLAVFHRLLAKIKPIGWHVVLHLDAEDILTQQELLNSIDVPFIIDHMGRVKAAEGLEQKPFQLLLELFRSNPLAWVKVCGSERVSVGKRPFRDAVPFAQALIAIDPRRILWGTDWPHPNISKDMPNDGELVDLLAEIAPDARCARSFWWTSDAPLLEGLINHMIIDCHGHYTTAPATLQKFPGRADRRLKDAVDLPLGARQPISDDQIRESLENAQLNCSAPAARISPFSRRAPRRWRITSAMRPRASAGPGRATT